MDIPPVDPWSILNSLATAVTLVEYSVSLISWIGESSNKLDSKNRSDAENLLHDSLKDIQYQDNILQFMKLESPSRIMVEARSSNWSRIKGDLLKNFEEYVANESEKNSLMKEFKEFLRVFTNLLSEYYKGEKILIIDEKLNEINKKIDEILPPRKPLPIPMRSSELKEVDFLGVVLAGGRGKRVAHLSKSGAPKVFWTLDGERSLLQNTVERIAKLLEPSPGKISILATADLRSNVEQQLSLKDCFQWYEPEAKGTAVAIAYAIIRAELAGASPNMIMGFFPSDQYIYIKDSQAEQEIDAQKEFESTIKAAIKKAKEGDCLIILGTEPKHPVIVDGSKKFYGLDYGWIEPMPGLDEFRFVKDFLEKPSEEQAQERIDRGCLWNAGIFIAQRGVFQKLFEEFMPIVYGKLMVDWENAYKKIRRKSSFDITILEAIIDSQFAEAQLLVRRTDYLWDDLGNVSTIRDFVKRRWLSGVEYHSIKIGSINKIGQKFGDAEIIIDIDGKYVVIAKDKQAYVVSLEGGL